MNKIYAIYHTDLDAFLHYNETSPFFLEWAEYNSPDKEVLFLRDIKAALDKFNNENYKIKGLGYAWFDFKVNMPEHWLVLCNGNYKGMWEPDYTDTININDYMQEDYCNVQF